MARVLLINYEYPPVGGGGGNATCHIARSMARMGHEPFVLTAQCGALPYVELADGITLRRIPALRQRRDRATVPEMLAFMAAAATMAPGLARHWKIDAVLTFFTLPSAPVGWLLKRRNRLPYVISLQGGDVPGFDPGRMKLYHALTGGVISRLWGDANAVVANSEGLANLARKHMPGRRIDVIPAGADVVGIAAKTTYAPPAGHETREITLLFVGRLVRQKGLDVLIEALAKIDSALKWRLLLVGDGPEWPAIAGDAARLGLAPRLELTGWVAKAALPEIYRAADIFVLPSRDEGMPNALLEAMAAGLPVIASDVAGSREVVIDGKTGLLVPPENPAALATALETLLAEPARREAFGRAARARVESTYGWDIVAAAWMRFIEQAIAEGPLP